MKIIELLLKKLKALFSKDTISLNKGNYIGTVSFILSKDRDIDVQILLPNIKDKGIDDLTSLSEKYGFFLTNISDGSLSEIMLEGINKLKGKCKDPVQQLFIENIIFFWSILYAEKKSLNKRKQKKNSPIIRPLSVFSDNQLN